MIQSKATPGLPLVDRLRGCMLQNVPANQTSGRCSSLPYDAADLIEELEKALLEVRGMFGPSSLGRNLRAREIIDTALNRGK
jgi:hypothetical protein